MKAGVGSAGALSGSIYGTSDQGGNVWEWNATALGVSSRVLRGGSWDIAENCLRSSFQNSSFPALEVSNVGFRVAKSASPRCP
ncbi:MAG: SUMF1/EgtB/PvdO family nonheme iron enzyme [Planctomycetes bacterium]|nr:SUMF1/EgtB/PvdO family nonheme iron enzyme [Planctomycetota bacterium]